MNERVRLNVEEVHELFARYKEINMLDIKNVDFYHNDKHVMISDIEIDEWKYTGLGTMYFVECVVDEICKVVK